MSKRLFDFTLAGVGLTALSPLFMLVAIWIKLDSRGPVFFRQERVGLRGRLFRIHKFRTMRVSTAVGLQITAGADPRITRSGRFLRKTKLDELPQLIDVLFGRMSLVGPRPEVPKYMALYPELMRAKVLSVRPGITDWASVRFRDESVLLGRAQDAERAYIEEILPIKQKFYIEYVETRSFTGDIRILAATVMAIVRKS